MDNSAPKRPRGRPKSAHSVAKPDTVQALDRGLVILQALARSGGANLTDLAMTTGMPPSSVHRTLATLEKHGFVSFDNTPQHWCIGIEAFRTGNAFLARSNLVEAAREPMRRLVNDTGETANLAIADGADVVFVSQVESYNPIRAFFNPGTRGAMHASGIGKALLAEMPHALVVSLFQRSGLASFTPNTLSSPKALFKDLEKIKRQGWSFDNEEHYAGMRCVGACIYNAFGEAIGGLSVSGPAVRFSAKVCAELGPKVVRAAAEVSAKMGAEPLQ